jgi:hypothetical protein
MATALAEPETPSKLWAVQETILNSTKHKAQSTKHKAQSTKHKAQTKTKTKTKTKKITDCRTLSKTGAELSAMDKRYRFRVPYWLQGKPESEAGGN